MNAPRHDTMTKEGAACAMKPMIRTVLIAAATTLMAACSTPVDMNRPGAVALTGSLETAHQTIRVIPQPATATCEWRGNEFQATTTGAQNTYIKMSASPVTITCNAEGHEAATRTIESENLASPAWTATKFVLNPLAAAVSEGMCADCRYPPLVNVVLPPTPPLPPRDTAAAREKIAAEWAAVRKLYEGPDCEDGVMTTNTNWLFCSDTDVFDDFLKADLAALGGDELSKSEE